MNSPDLPGPTDQAHDVLRLPVRHSLAPLFAPRSLAVVGATDRPGSIGHALVQNLKHWGGRSYFVNPGRSTVNEAPAFPSVDALPRAVDVAIIATPAPTVPGILRACSARGVRGVVIISAGFKETSEGGILLEQEVQAVLRETGIRALGPSSFGLMMPHSGLNVGFGGDLASPGKVAFLSQSGALCAAVLDWSRRERVGFSGFVSLGAMSDVGWGEVISYFGDDPHTRSIVCYMESLGEARRFLSAVREVALNKPVIVLKARRHEEASRISSSHSGLLGSSDAVLDAALHRVGALRVNTLAELFDMAEVLGKQPPPKGPRLAIVTNAVGPGTLAADMLVASGGRPADLAPETRSAIDVLLPKPWSHRPPPPGPGEADTDRFATAVALAAADPAPDGLCMILTPMAVPDPVATAQNIVHARHPRRIPLLACWMGGTSMDEARDVLNAGGIPTYDFPDTAARAFALMWRYGENLRTLYETPQGDVTPEEEMPASSKVAAVLNQAVSQGRTVLSEAESKQILALYGIPVAEARVASSPDEAARLASEMGYPVAVKVHSLTVTHKAALGGVRLHVPDEAAVKRAFAAISTTIDQSLGPGHFQGVTIQSMEPGEGWELFLGSHTDPQFGPALLFGAGGARASQLRDQATGLPPLNATLARRLMEQTRVFQALQGDRGLPHQDLARLGRVLTRFSRLVAAHRRIAEIDINPLFISRGRISALDARIILHPPWVPEERLPRTAIRPYPTRYVRPYALRDGTNATLRPIRPEDEPAMVRFHETLSPQTVYQRYFSAYRLDQRVAHERLSRLCFIDYDCEMAIVAVRPSPDTGDPDILGIGRLSKLHGTTEGEFALLIADDWQHHGLGLTLLRLLVEVARDERLTRVTATILPDNRAMQAVARRAGFRIISDITAGECQAVLELHRPQPDEEKPGTQSVPG